MKTKLIILVTLLFVICTSCKKNDCVYWNDPEDESISISLSDYNSASDVASMFSVRYPAGCDDSKINSLLDMDGAVIKVYGVLGHHPFNFSKMIYNPGQDGVLPMAGNTMDTLTEDSVVYYVTGILHLRAFEEDIIFKKNIMKESPGDYYLTASLTPLSYFVME